MMEMIANFDIFSAITGVIIGGTVGFFTGRSGTIDLNQALNSMRQQLYEAYIMLVKERELNDGLTQELAAQAKLIK